MSGDPTSDVPSRALPVGARRAARAAIDPDRGLPWLVGVVAALVILGPGLAPGGLFNLDLVVPDQLPVPRGAWGLGPEAPRRVPLWLVPAWLGTVLGAPVVVKAMIVAAVAGAVAGAWRLARRAGAAPWAAAGAGLLYGASPFALTRLGIGHLMVIGTLALLPWALDDLVHPDRSLRRTFLWGVALSVPNFFGGSVAALVVGVGLLASRGRRTPAVLGALVASQALWLVPALAVWWSGSGGELSGSSAFATQADGPLGWGQVLAGHGFWQPPLQVGWPDLYDLPGPAGWVVAAIGFALLALAVVGQRARPDELGTRPPWVAALGVGIAVVGTLPLLGGPVDWFTGTWLGGPFREAQRYLVLYLVWMAPAAGVGATRLAERLAAGPGARPALGAAAAVVVVAPLAAALVLAGPGVWGIDGALAPRDLPEEWRAVRAAVQEDPGPVVALPFLLYLDVPFQDGTSRRMLNPVPLYLGGDVVTGSDPLLGGTTQERPDPREGALADPLVALRTRSVDGTGPRDALSVAAERLGIRWVVLVDGGDAGRYRAVAEDPGLELVVDGATIQLYEVRSWPGLVTAGDEVLAVDPVAAPLLEVPASGPALVRRPAASGWRRGTASASASPDGLLALPAGSGPLWYWPAALVLVGDVAVVVATAWCIRRGRQSRR